MSFEQKQYWLKGVEYERDRIIKLIEANTYLYDLEREYVVALIKGEEQ